MIGGLPMELHNTVEDIVIPKVENIFNTLEKEGNTEKLCTCSQCRIDTACYVLNRITPFYLVSNRGAARVQQETIEHQQKVADITSLIYEGLKRVSHNQRPNFTHDSSQKKGSDLSCLPVYNIPTITGRLLNGNNFAPVSDVYIKLLYDGSPIPMNNENWQNPFHLVSHTEGTYSFWPVSFPAKDVNEHKVFEFTICVETKEYEELNHVFRIPVTSELQTIQSFTLKKSYKLQDLFMFPPGENEQNLYLV